MMHARSDHTDNECLGGPAVDLPDGQNHRRTLASRSSGNVGPKGMPSGRGRSDAAGPSSHASRSSQALGFLRQCGVVGGYHRNGL